MMRVRDCNGARLLTLITKVLLRQGGLINSQQSDVFGKLWDEISKFFCCNAVTLWLFFGRFYLDLKQFL